MPSDLPLNLEDLLHHRTVEQNRIEYKAVWSGEVEAAVVRTICGFANDFLNLNGGYIILGVGEEEGRPTLPPVGLDPRSLDRIQREILGSARMIQPTYVPRLFPATVGDRHLLVIWCPGGDNRPYEAPERARVKGSPRKYWVRQGPQTIGAEGDLRRQLLELTARTPFDDRRNPTARFEDISPALVRRFLHEVGSSLVNDGNGTDHLALCRHLRLTVPVNAHEDPRNVALLCFSNDPDAFFPGCRIEVVEFGDDAGGDPAEERVFRGPLPDQIRGCLTYLQGLLGTLLQKQPDVAEAERIESYPYRAIEEAVVNAVHHRSYEYPPEPVKIYLYPNRMEIISYPGPVAGLELEHLQPGAMLPPVPGRNRRIGEFLKELRLAEARGTGLARIHRGMRENGSPPAVLDFDEGRTYFRVRLPIHPRYQVLHALREAGQLWATGSREQAISHLERAAQQQPQSGALAGQLIEYAFSIEKPELAYQALRQFEEGAGSTDPELPLLAMARRLLDRRMTAEAVDHLRRVVDSLGPSRRTSRVEVRRLLGETLILLRRAVSLSEDPAEQAWCWFYLSRVLRELGEPAIVVEAALDGARAILPDEVQFRPMEVRGPAEGG